jgi:hypothetical protein
MRLFISTSVSSILFSITSIVQNTGSLRMNILPKKEDFTVDDVESEAAERMSAALHRVQYWKSAIESLEVFLKVRLLRELSVERKMSSSSRPWRTVSACPSTTGPLTHPQGLLPSSISCASLSVFDGLHRSLKTITTRSLAVIDDAMAKHSSSIASFTAFDEACSDIVSESVTLSRDARDAAHAATSARVQLSAERASAISEAEELSADEAKQDPWLLSYVAVSRRN